MSVLRIRRPGRLAAEAAALLIAAMVAFPLYWMVLSALKPTGEIQSTAPGRGRCRRPWTPSAGCSNSTISAATSSTA